MKKTARYYHCVRCHCQVIICRDCDRGNIYCGPQCAQPARLESRRRASKKYQRTREGRMANAQRQQRYRQRKQQKVTYQGSLASNANVSLSAATKTRFNATRHVLAEEKTVIHCHFCHGECDLFLRSGFIRRRTRYP